MARVITFGDPTSRPLSIDPVTTRIASVDYMDLFRLLAEKAEYDGQWTEAQLFRDFQTMIGWGYRPLVAYAERFHQLRVQVETEAAEGKLK